MINILLFLLPAGLSLKIKDDFFKEDMDAKDYILTLIKYTLIINFLMFTLLFLYSKGADVSLSISLDNISFIFKYMALSTILAILVPISDEFLKKNISLKINLKKIEDKDDKKNK